MVGKKVRRPDGYATASKDTEDVPSNILKHITLPSIPSFVAFGQMVTLGLKDRR